MAKAKRRASASGEETRQKILEATLRTLQSDGIVGASARAIARSGDFNQALIFYHFGSVDGAIVAAVGELSHRRLERYKEPLLGATTLTDLIDVARDLYEEDRESGEVTILAQAFAGASRDAEMGPVLYDHIDAWNNLVAEVVERAVRASPLGDTPIGRTIPQRQIALAISALFLGIELLGQLDPRRVDAEEMFAGMAAVVLLAESMLETSFSAG